MKFLYVSVHLNEAEMVPNPQFLPLSTMELSPPASERLHSPLLLYLLRNTWLVSLNSLSHRLFLSRVSRRHGVCAFTQFFRVTTVIGKVKLLFIRIFKQTCFQPPWHLYFQRALLFPILETSWHCLVGNSATVTPKLFPQPTSVSTFFFLVS